MFPHAIIPLYIIPVHLFSFCREWRKANATAEQQYLGALPLHDLHETAGQNQQMQLIAESRQLRRSSARLSQGTPANYTGEHVTTDESINHLHHTHS